MLWQVSGGAPAYELSDFLADGPGRYACGSVHVGGYARPQRNGARSPWAPTRFCRSSGAAVLTAPVGWSASVFAGQRAEGNGLVFEQWLAKTAIGPLARHVSGRTSQPADTLYFEVIELRCIGLDIEERCAIHNIHVFNFEDGAAN